MGDFKQNRENFNPKHHPIARKVLQYTTNHLIYSFHNKSVKILLTLNYLSLKLPSIIEPRNTTPVWYIMQRIKRPEKT